ncbi:MAG TPA: aldo/keto reductase [Burkholderiales bacterium]|nr:aldo/keto reductase [Burkholderiales bacterium]
MISRREWLQRTMGAGGLLALNPRAVLANPAGLITRVIPGTNEQLPIVGLGSSATFAQVARSDDVDALRAVLKQMVDLGGRVFDTAPSYGASEEVAGRMAQELKIEKKLFWATKLNVASRGGGSADPKAAREQLETSFRRIGKPAIDLVQVHNLGDLPTQLPILRDYKEKGRIRYIGVTTTFEQYADLVQLMRKERIDFIGIDYAVDNRQVEETILPLARDKGIGVLVYMPFGRTRLWQRVKGHEVPDWAREFDANSWAQFFLKYIASHPSVTAITPATSRPSNMADNMGGAVGRLPDAAMRKRMIQLMEELP